MELNNTFKVRKTLIEMLKDRNYTINNTNEVNFEEFMIMYEENNYDVVDENNKIIGYFFKEHKAFGKKDLENVVSDIKEKYGNDIRIIIVVKDKYNVSIEKELANPFYRNIEIFLFENLTFNITKYKLIPKHIPLNEEEAKKVLEHYKITKAQIPKMQVKDPVARYYGVKGGTIMKIIRNSPSSGEYVTYRYVR